MTPSILIALLLVFYNNTNSTYAHLNRGSSQSQAGSEFVSRILTVVTSLKAQQRNPLDYLTQACLVKRLGLSAPSLLPSTLGNPETPIVA